MSIGHQASASALVTRPAAAGVGNVVSAVEIMAALGQNAPAPLQALLAQARRAEFPAHAVLHQQGNGYKSITFITAGLLKLVAHLPNGRARIIRLHRPGSVLGLSGLLGRENEYMAVALTPVAALRLPLEALQQLRRDDSTTYAILLERWYQNLETADTWITEFSTGPIRGRVARLLTFLSDFEPDALEGQVQLFTCEEMGSMLGVTPESVSRILAEFKRQHILNSEETGSDETYQADVNRLREIGDAE